MYRFIILLILAMFTMVSNAKEFALTKLVTGKSGHSYFENVSMSMRPAKVGFVTNELTMKNGILGSAGPGEQSLHNPPYAAYIIVLSGIMQIETSKKVARNFKAGDILLAEDVSGKGHMSRSVNDTPVKYLLLKSK